MAMAWCFEEDSFKDSVEVLEALSAFEAMVPSLWPLEVANALIVAERHKRLTEAETHRFVSLLDSLPIIVDAHTHQKALNEILVIGRDYQLTSYDASYLELSMRKGLALATFDQQLIKVCHKIGIPIFQN